MITREGRLEVKWSERRHVKQLVEVLAACYPDEAWTEKDVLAFNNNSNTNNVSKVLVDGNDRVYGCMLYTMTADHCRLRRVAVRPSHQRAGMATCLIHALTGLRSPVKRRKFVARVAERNLVGQCLLRKMKFEFDPLATRQKDGNGEDYYVFTFMKPEARRLLVS